jgi:hypothetical protein
VDRYPDVGSIPIVRSINSDDSVDLARLKHGKTALKWPVLVGSWREVTLTPIGRYNFGQTLRPIACNNGP